MGDRGDVSTESCDDSTPGTSSVQSRPHWCLSNQGYKIPEKHLPKIREKGLRCRIKGCHVKSNVVTVTYNCNLMLCITAKRTAFIAFIWINNDKT